MLLLFSNTIKLIDQESTQTQRIDLFNEFVKAYMESFLYCEINKIEFSPYQECTKFLFSRDLIFLDKDENSQTIIMGELNKCLINLDYAYKKIFNILFVRLRFLNKSSVSFEDHGNKSDDKSQEIFPVTEFIDYDSILFQQHENFKKFLSELMNEIQANDFNIQFQNQFYTQFKQYNIVLPSEILNSAETEVNSQKIKKDVFKNFYKQFEQQFFQHPNTNK